MNHYEVEVKVLLGSRTEADRLLAGMGSSDSSMSLDRTESQLNHYFMDGDVRRLAQEIDSHLVEGDRARLLDIVARGRDHSVRTRYILGVTSILVVKSSINDETSANSTTRLECEIRFDGMDEQTLDGIVLASGYGYQAKWSRDRSEYHYLGMSVSIDRNAGYGYLAEFERVVQDPADVPAAKQSILENIEALGYHELDQKKLADMFAFYNANWRDYYGTDKIFTL